MRAKLRVALAGLLTSMFVAVGFYAPTGSASAVVPFLATPCVGSSLCSPAGPAILAELSAQGGTAGAVTTAGTTLTAAESAAFTGIVAGYGTTATTSGSAIIAAGAASGAGSTAAGLISGGGLAILAGGVLGWNGTVDPTVAAALPPAGGGTTAGVKSLSFTVPSTSYVIQLDLSPTSGDPTKVTFVLSTPAGMSSGSNVYGQLRCGTTWQGSATFAQAYWKGQTALGGPFTQTPTNPCGSGVTPTGFRVLYGGTFAGATNMAEGDVPATTTAGGRYVQQTVTCKNSAGATTTITNSTPAASIVGGAAITLAGLMCPSGYRLYSWTAAAKGSGVADVDLGSYTSSIPDADPCGYIGGTLCTLRLMVNVGTSTSPSWKSCHNTAYASACTSWSTAPERTTKYRCEYGTSASTRVVGLGACSIYRNSFPADSTTTPPTLDEPQPLPPIPGTPTDGSCDLGWGDLLNGTIVFKAVGCALSWAFVPSDAVLQEAQTTVSTAWSSTAPGQIASAANDASAPLRGLEGADSSPDCLGPHVNWTFITGLTVDAYPFSTCDDFRGSLAGYFKPILGAVALLGGFSQAVRLIAGTISLPTTRTVA